MIKLCETSHGDSDCIIIIDHFSKTNKTWGHGKNSHKIAKLQKWALRTTLNLKYNAHTSPFFHKYSLLKFEDVRDLSIACKMRQYIIDEAPPIYYDNEFFDYHAERNRRPHYFKLSLTKKPLDKLPLYIFPTVWNSLKLGRNDLKISKKAFKNMMKSRYIDKYEVKCTKRKCYPCGRSGR